MLLELIASELPKKTLADVQIGQIARSLRAKYLYWRVDEDHFLRATGAGIDYKSRSDFELGDIPVEILPAGTKLTLTV